MRTRSLALFVAALAVLPLSCSLVVQSELDSKPSGTGGSPNEDASADVSPDQGGTGGTGFDATPDVTDDAADAADASDAADANEQDAPADANDETPACTGCTAEECCNGVCADLTSDNGNCGACGVACPADRTCTASACSNGWVTMTAAPQNAERARACAVWAGDRVFIWGGMKLPGNELRDDGLTYDPKNDQWDALAPDASAPSARAEPVCLWTGTKVFVWGGVDPITKTQFQDGSLWDPATGTWEQLATGGPIGRSRPVALWTGTSVVLWGGTNLPDNKGAKSGATWIPNADPTWKALSLTEAPTKNKELAAVWTGTDVLVFGGRDDGGGNVYNTIYGYTPPAPGVWSLIALDGTPPAVRANAFAAYANAHMMVWGGFDKSFVALGDGARAKLTAPVTWVALSTDNAPSARAAVPFESGWIAKNGSRAHLLGGVTSSTTVATDGGSYDIKADTWEPISSWGPASHQYGIGVWSGTEFIVWGGYDGSTALVDGSRWMP